MKLLRSFGRPAALLAVCAAAAFAAGGCVASTAPGDDGDPEHDGQVAQSLGAEDKGTPSAGRSNGPESLRAKTAPPDQSVESTLVEEQSDPDPEPWHGGTKATSSNAPGKHD